MRASERARLVCYSVGAATHHRSWVARGAPNPYRTAVAFTAKVKQKVENPIITKSTPITRDGRRRVRGGELEAMGDVVDGERDAQAEPDGCDDHASLTTVRCSGRRASTGGGLPV